MLPRLAILKVFSLIVCLTLCWRASATGAPDALADWSRLDDDAVTQQARQLGAQGLMQRLESGVEHLPEYELWMARQERLSTGWNEQPFLHHIKYRHSPRQVYMSWLPGGPKSGQEILFDETRRSDAMYGHLSGVFNVMSMWTSLDGSLARSNSMHSIREVGLQSVVDILKAQQEVRRRAGVSIEPDEIRIDRIQGERVLAVSWPATPGLAHAYAARTRLYLDLKHPWVRQVEAWDERGQLKERVYYQRVQPARFTARDFDPQNPDYRF
ncbi:MAG TPA: DUF1571 domain-containing protein [Aquabacterium sp.]|nr:DUF1571 domain-containing protein [Aquabacterium sp.]